MIHSAFRAEHGEVPMTHRALRKVHWNCRWVAGKAVRFLGKGVETLGVVGGLPSLAFVASLG